MSETSFVAMNQFIVMNQWFDADTAGVNWIAFNPQVAKGFGWTLATDGLFRWVDSAGDPMVETIWWKDGCIDLQPYEDNNEVGEGFLVLASHKAVSEIMKYVKNPTRFLMIQRSCRSDSQELVAPAVQTNEPFIIS